MAARVSGRFAPAPPPHIELATLPRPQVIDEHGFELSDEQLEALAAAAAQDTPGEEGDATEAADETAAAVIPDNDESRVPLLGVAESLILHYSLVQTRQHHLSQLLPLAFSHPPVPAYSRPRRPPPRGGFVFPTPPLGPLPLPASEYHGPAKQKEGKGKEKEGGDGKEGDEGDSHDMPKKKKGKQTDGVQAPAHEIECIGRVNLQVGPLSFPDTELWVGRFVQQRLGTSGTVRGKVKGAVPKPPRTSLPAAKRQRMEPPKPQAMSATRPPAYSYPQARPRPPTPGATAPGTRPSGPHSDIPQELIQRVNAAASRHPWLSILIHKAARSIASKDELAKLGRVVARLGRGEDVGEGPETPGIPPPAAGATGSSVARPAPSGGPARLPAGPPRPPLAGPSRPPPAPAATGTQPAATGTAKPIATPAASVKSAAITSPVSSTSSLSSDGAVSQPAAASASTAVPAASSASVKPREDDSDSDDEVDMKGRPQEGGGPLPAKKAPATPKAKAPASAGARSSTRVASASATKSSAAAVPASPTPQPAAKPGALSAISSSPAAPIGAVATKAATLGASAQQPSAATTSAAPKLPATLTATAASVTRPAPARPPTSTRPPATARPPTAASAPTVGAAVRPSGGTPARPLVGQAMRPPTAARPPTGPGRPPTTQPAPRPPTSTPPRPPIPYVTYPPLPPKVTHPLPPPFLLVAFKEAPTEKFVLPLGQNSFISRVGGDYVTTAPPVSVAAPKPPPPETAVKPELEQVAGKKRTRGSIAKPAEAAVEAESIPDVNPAAAKKDLFTNLPVVPGMEPERGTVLLSTFLPEMPWQRPDWESFMKRLPFNNPEFIEKLKSPPKPVVEVKPEPTSPKRSFRHLHDEHANLASREGMLNLAAEPWFPSEGALEPITIRLVGVQDHVWRRMKSIVDEVEKVELESLARLEPELNQTAGAAAGAPAAASSTPAAASNTPAKAPAAPGAAAPPTPATPATAAASSTSTLAATTTPVPAASSSTPARQATPATPAVTAIVPLPPKPPAPLVRDTWLARRKALFSSLLSRVGPRRFPRFRVESTLPALVEAFNDKWAAKPMHMTTRPLYASGALGEDVGEGVEIDLDLELEDGGRKRRKGDEPSVTFEMPVSLDALDERVEAGAAKALARRTKKGQAPVRKFRRGTAGAVCEGCAKPGLKVWRRGPNGRSTLCNACGDKFLAGTLGELLAPGAASGAVDGTPDTPTPAGEKGEGGVKSEPGEGQVTEAQMGRGAEADAGGKTTEEDAARKNGEEVAVKEKVADADAAGEAQKAPPTEKAAAREEPVQEKESEAATDVGQRAATDKASTADESMSAPPAVEPVGSDAMDVD